MNDDSPRSEPALPAAAAVRASPSPAPPAAAPAETLGLVAVYTVTIFLSALLLFSIQPLFAKMVLPVLGGSPSVWAVAICFFQAALLAGYCYAHLLNARLPLLTGGLSHLVLCGVAAVSLPIALPAWFGEPPPGEPYLWQLGLFTLAIGLPFVAVSANAPLLQAWFAKTAHRHASDPYFLYAASNLGSLIALLGYPFILEPAFGVRQLSSLWTGGYFVLIAALASCLWLAIRARAPEPSPADAAQRTTVTGGPPPTWHQRLGWIGLAFVPAALLTAFTTHVTTDVASAPLLWVGPLALYLSTFVLVFRERTLIPLWLLRLLHVVAVIVALLQLSQTRHDTWYISSTTGVAAFFLAAMAAHRTLYEARPAARSLTEFYLWMALGGCLGGLFAALLAPKLFSEVFEYPLLLALSLACQPGALAPLVRVVDWAFAKGSQYAAEVPGFSKLRSKAPAGALEPQVWNEVMVLWLMFAGGILVLFWVPWATRQFNVDVGRYGLAANIVLAFGLLLLLFYHYPQRQLILALLMFGAVVTLPSSVRRGEAQRSYFGVYRVMVTEDREFHILTHGTTLHGAQRVRDANKAAIVDTTPATYYHPKSPMAQAFDIVRTALAANNKQGRYGVIGLGTGSLGCYRQDGERWRFFEIDPVVVNIAKTPAKFSFLSNCMPEPDIVLGDARLTLAKEPDQSFDLIIVDAFTSDAVPLHLMTAEALQLYHAKLAPDGVVILHISNRYLDLDAVLGATVPLVPELKGFILSDDTAFDSYEGSTSTVGVFAKSEDMLDLFRGVATVSELNAGKVRPWSDDYSDVLGPLLARWRR